MKRRIILAVLFTARLTMGFQDQPLAALSPLMPKARMFGMGVFFLRSII
ncbi:hypothetical protein [Shimia ponticola]|nr:hypothetical protein [Shimia ponticola]